jgi:hypothetical protein
MSKIFLGKFAMSTIKAINILIISIISLVVGILSRFEVQGC